MANIIGTNGPDEMEGTTVADDIDGRGGRDVLWGDGALLYLYEPEGFRFEGADDRIHGGAGRDVLWGDTTVKNAGAVDFVGGDDHLSGGDGHDLLYGDGYAFEVESGTFVGGDDRLVGGKGDDVLHGDGGGRDGDPFQGGADVFVFRKHYGRDLVVDFRLEDGDRVEFADMGRRLNEWSDLDGNGDGVVDAADRSVRETDEGTLEIDVGRLTRSAAKGEDVLIIGEVIPMTEGDFLFT